MSKPRYDGPPIITEAVAASLADPKLLDLDAEIGVVYARMQQEIARLKEANFASGAWSDLSLRYDQLVAAMNASDSNAIRENLLAIGDLAKGGVDDDRTWGRILRLIERRRRLVESQRKREAELDLRISRTEMLKIAHGLLESVTKFVRDPQTIKAIHDEFQAVVGAINGGGTIH